MDNDNTKNSMRIKILEIFEKLVKDGIWTEWLYLQEVNRIKDIKDEDLKDVLWYLQTQDDY
jgi:hypothetical protein